MENRPFSAFDDAIALFQQVANDSAIHSTLRKIIDDLTRTFQAGGKALFCGNGGSAGDAQHLAAEFSGRFNYDRPPLYAEALHVNTSYLTAVANDYSYDEVYARAVRGMGRKGDVLFGISTSGNSVNVVKALEAGREMGMITVGMTGFGGGRIGEIAEHLLAIPSTDTARIQELHIHLGHQICEHVELNLFPRP